MRWDSLFVAAGVAALLSAAACSGDDESNGEGSGEDLFGNATPGSGDDDDAPGASGASGSGASDGTTFGPGAVTGPGGLYGSEACKHVDLVIAVDGSSSMTEELEAMRDDIFPAFARRLQSIAGGIEDFRVATLDACPQPASFHTRGASQECGFDGGNVWIESDSSAINDEFACVGEIYQEDHSCSGDNDDEQPATAIATALEAPMRDGPNEGFLRSESLLVAVAITDEDEQPTGDERSAEEVYNRLVEVVGDDPRRMVFLGIGGSGQCQGAYGDAEDARRLRNVTDLFGTHDRGVFWDLCQGRLEDGLEEAFRVIDKACQELPPPDECSLDEDCGSGTPNDPPGRPSFCVDFPEDPSCQLD